jgi:hypothetical protein
MHHRSNICRCITNSYFIGSAPFSGLKNKSLAVVAPTHPGHIQLGPAVVQHAVGFG